MKTLCSLALALALVPARASAQPAPITGTTIKSTDSSASSLCVGCPTTSAVPAANSGAKIQTITLPTAAAPSVTTEKLYNISGGLYWNGALLATGASVSGTLNTIGMFTGATSIGNSLLTFNGVSTITMAGTLSASAFGGGTFSGTGAGLTGIPTTGITGNFVATVASGTGITSSVVTGNAAATTISLNNTAVTPAQYGLSGPASVTIDQQGRITAAAAVTFGTYALSTAGTGFQVLSVANSTSNGTSGSEYRLTAGSSRVSLFNQSQGYTTGTWDIAASGTLYADGVGGLSLVTADASGPIRLYTNQTLRAQILAAGSWSLGSAGNITDAVATPTITSGFGGSPSIAGKAFAFVVTVGTGSPTTGLVAFNATFANVPACIASNSYDSGNLTVTPTTGGVTVTVPSGGWGVGSLISVICRGF